MITTIRASLKLLTTRQRLAVALLSAATLIVNVLDIVAISLLSIVGALALGDTSEVELPWFDEVEPNSLVIWILLLAAVVFAIKTTSGILLTRLRQNFLAALEISFSRIIAADIFAGELTTVRKHSRSHLEWSILRSTSIAFGGVIGQTLSLFAEVSLTIFILGLFFATDWISALLVTGYFMIVLVVFQLATKRKVSNTGADYSEGSVSVGEAISDMITGFKEITVHSRVAYFLDRIHRARERTARAYATQSYVQQIPRLVVELALIVGAIGFTAFQFSVSAGEPDLGVISIFIVGSLRIMSSLLPLYRSFMQLRFEAPQAFHSQALVRDAQLSALQESRRDSQSESDSNPITDDFSAGLQVSLTEICFEYNDRGSREIAIDGISLDISGGSTAAFIGPSGAGKSTLVDVILGLHTPSHGEVLCGGHKPGDLRASFPGLISYVPQKPGLMASTVRENVALGIPVEEIDDKGVWEALELARLDSFVSKLPNGIDTKLGKHADSLSGGQIQRIGLARALFTKPRLLVLDEATSALDAETEAAISGALYALGSRTTRIIVAHRLSTVQHADTVFVINQGRLIGCGTLRELERSIPMVRNYLKLAEIGE